MKKALLLIVGLFFALLAFMFLTGLYLDFPIVALNTPTPFLANVAAFLVTALLSFCFFAMATKTN